jgi:GTP pyrophosphokinase
MSESRKRFFEQRLADAGQTMSLKALDFVVSEMSATKGFKRHDGSDYWGHCIDVAQDLWNAGIRDEDIISAALLHDVLEDIDGMTYMFLADKFNHEIADIVQGVTKTTAINYKEGDNIKTKYLDLMLHDYRMCLVKAADRKHNFSTLKDATPEKKMRQAKETETYYFPWLKELVQRYPRYSAYFLSAKTAIKPHLMEIKEHYEEVQDLKIEIEKLRAAYHEIADEYTEYRRRHGESRA